MNIADVINKEEPGLRKDKQSNEKVAASIFNCISEEPGQVMQPMPGTN